MKRYIQHLAYDIDDCKKIIISVFRWIGLIIITIILSLVLLGIIAYGYSYIHQYMERNQSNDIIITIDIPE